MEKVHFPRSAQKKQCRSHQESFSRQVYRLHRKRPVDMWLEHGVGLRALRVLLLHARHVPRNAASEGKRKRREGKYMERLDAEEDRYVVTENSLDLPKRLLNSTFAQDMLPHLCSTES